MKDTVTQVVTAFSPILIALITGFFGARLGRRTKAVKIMERLKGEAETAEVLPEGSAAKQTLLAQLDATARQYEEACKLEDTFRRDSSGVVLGFLIGGSGIALGSWAALAGGAYLWWWILAIPMIIVGVTGFFYEMAGGKSRQSGEQSAAPAEDEATGV
ncbi:hypothetical protein [Streptomyces sp. CRN 30]|uniref:hypothetical protein n=1 Tax=Streptomyces sp. CRN 30 TaxID=3075613 RepID=UPI002A83D528|nr:hypothetical protein [Streptomyces sp. CRN 30]